MREVVVSHFSSVDHGSGGREKVIFVNGGSGEDLNQLQKPVPARCST